MTSLRDVKKVNIIMLSLLCNKIKNYNTANAKNRLIVYYLPTNTKNA